RACWSPTSWAATRSPTASSCRRWSTGGRGICTFILSSLGPGHHLGNLIGAARVLTSGVLSVWVAGYRTVGRAPCEPSPVLCALPLLEGWRDVDQVRREHQGQGGTTGP